MSAPTIDPGDIVDGVTTAVTAGVSGNLDKVGVLAGSLMAIGVVWGLIRRAVRAK